MGDREMIKIIISGITKQDKMAKAVKQLAAQLRRRHK